MNSATKSPPYQTSDQIPPEPPSANPIVPLHRSSLLSRTISSALDTLRDGRLDEEDLPEVGILGACPGTSSSKGRGISVEPFQRQCSARMERVVLKIRNQPDILRSIEGLPELGKEEYFRRSSRVLLVGGRSVVRNLRDSMTDTQQTFAARSAIENRRLCVHSPIPLSC